MNKALRHKLNLLFFICAILWLPQLSIAQRGKDGNRIISTNNTVVNEYTLLSADANAGNNVINVVSSSLNDNSRFPASLAAGDLLFIIQLQGASIHSIGPFNAGNGDFAIPKDSSWGAITNYNNCGNHEFTEVLSVISGTGIELSCPLRNNYTAAGKVMVVRVPRFETLTINAGASINCDIYTGNFGGIIAVEVKDQTVVNGSITANGRGFRGGNAFDVNAFFGTDDTAQDNIIMGAEKGEGIAGFYNEYDNIPELAGRYSRGAAANAGGGGNALNAGGGGGGNGGNIANYTGKGNPSLATANWANAWNLEWNGFANSTSSGGGRGGYSAAVNNQNALINGPGNGNWGGDSRSNVGGFGGRPLDYTNGKIFMGGGGGAGQGDDNFAGSGGRGGGLIYLILYGDLSGSGSITADGAAGTNAVGPPAGFGQITGRDGAGGGGAGGTIIIESNANITGVTASANGGNGGNQVVSVGAFANPEAQGPGGGGGGGHISTSAPMTATVNGGQNGTTNSSYLSEFTPNGATAGGIGNQFSNQTFFDIEAADQSICANSSVTLIATVDGTLPTGAVITWYDAEVGGNVLGTGSSFTTPTLNASTTYYVGTCPGTFRDEVTVTVTPGVTAAIAGNDFSACPGDVVVLAANTPSSGAGTWQIISGNASLSSNTDPAANITIGQGGNITLEWVISAPGCPSSTDQLIVTVNPAPTAANAGSDQNICGTAVSLNGNTPLVGTGTWQVLSGAGNFSSPNQSNATVTGLQPGINVFSWVIDNGLCPSTSDLVTIQVDEVPSNASAGSDQTICSSTALLSANTPSIGNGTWTIISGSGTLSNPNDPASNISGLGAGIITLEWSISNGVCPPSTDQISINVLQPSAPADAGTDQTLCASSANLSGSNPGAGIGSWSIISGTGTISNQNSPNTSITGLNPGVLVLEWAISLPGCPPNTDQITITVDAAPDAANAGSDQTICLGAGNSLTLSANNPSTGTGSWSVISGSGSLSSVSDPAATLTGLSTGTTILEWTTSNGVCPVSTDQIVITALNAPSPALAGSDIQICENNTSGINLNAQSPANGTGTWSVATGNIVVSNPSDPGSLLNNIQSGTNVLVWNVSVPGCAANTDTVVIQIDALPSNADAGTDQTICISGSGSATLNAVAPAGGAGSWAIVSGNGNIQNNNQANSILNILSTGNIILSWTVSNGVCPSSTDQVSIQAIQAPGPANAGQDQTVCQDPAIIINLSAATPANGTGSWSVFSGTGQVQNVNAQNTQISNLSVGNNQVIWTVSLSGCPSVSDTINIFATAKPSTADAGSDQFLCTESGITTSLSAATPAVGTGTWNIISGSGGVNNPQSAVSQVEGLIPGSTTLVWIVQNGVCPPSSDTLLIVVGNSDLSADAGSDVSIFQGESTNLNASGNGSFSWSPADGLSCIDCQNPTATPMTSTVYYLTVTSDEGCKQTDSIVVTIDLKKDWFIPSAFSPNNDGHNDVLYLRGYGIKSFSLQVFDRWGAMVFKTEDLSNGWDGNYQSKPASSGVYHWVLSLSYESGELVEQKGNITLAR